MSTAVPVESLPSALPHSLDLSASECPECVVPRDLMLDILRANLATADPDIRSVDVDDPREHTGYEAGAH